MAKHITEQERIAAYTIDCSELVGTAHSVVIPSTIEDLSEAFVSIQQRSETITLSGGGTGLVAGRVPNAFETDAAMTTIVSLEEFSTIKRLDEVHYSVGAGVRLIDLQNTIAKDHRLFTPDPTEWLCMFGGMVATNASGARSFKYGSTRDSIYSLDIVLSNGDKLTCNRGENVAHNTRTLVLTSESKIDYIVPPLSYTQPQTTKNTVGYYTSHNRDAIDLFIGSEGTLGCVVNGVISTITMPEYILGILCFFADHDAVFAAIESLQQTRLCSDTILSPRVVEFYDSNSLSFVHQTDITIPKNVCAALWIEQEFTTQSEDEVYQEWNKWIQKHTFYMNETIYSFDETHHNKLRKFRHSLPLAIVEYLHKKQQTKLGTDIAVPQNVFRSFTLYTQELFKEYNIQYVLFGHAGDSHLHANMFTTKDHSLGFLRTVIYQQLVERAVALGGTFSAEHGVGRSKKQYLPLLYSQSEIQQMKDVKSSLDPQWILNRGVILTK